MEIVKKEKKKEVKKKNSKAPLMANKKGVHEVSEKRIKDYAKNKKKK